MKKTKDKTESGPTFYQTARGKLLPSVYASALGRYYPYGGTFDMPRQQMYMPLDHVTAKGGYLAPILPMHFDKGTQIYRDTTALPFAEGGPLDENTGVHYKYPGNNSEYLKKGNQWFISNNNTDFNFVPIHDPKGTRAKELNKHATIYKNADKMSTADYEGKLNASLNNAMTRASRAGEFVAEKGEDPQDNFRHPMAGRYTAEAIANKTGNIPYVSNALGFLGSNALGIAHEASTIFSDDRPWGVKLTEAGEDIYNNAVGAKVGVSNMSAHAKTNYLKYLSNAYKIPDGYGEIHPYRNSWTDPYNQQNQSRVTNSLNTVPLTEKFAHGGKLMDFPAPSLSERETNINYNIYASMPGRYYSNGGQFLTAGGEYHRIYKNAEGDIMVNHPAEDKGKWDTINLTDKANAHTVAQGVAATKQWHLEHPNAYSNGGMIKRADGSYSQRGLWDNIRANKGSGKEPTKEMLAQERKIRANEHSLGGNIVKASHLFGMGGHKAVFFPTNVSEPGAADKDLTYPKDAYVYDNGGNLYDEGGPVYTYAGRPNARYRKEGNSWAISVDGGNSFAAIKDPTGKRTTLLNKQAKPIITTNYDPLLDNKIFPSETTQGVAQNYIMGKNLNQVAERKKVRDDYNQKAFEQSRVETIKAAPEYTTGDKVQNIVRNPLVALSYFMKPGEFAMPMNYSEFERSPNYSDETWGNNLVGQAVNAASYFHPLGLAAHAIDNVTYTSDDVQKAIQSGELADWKRAGMSGANAALDLFAGSKFIGNSGRLLNTGEKFTLDAMNASNKLGLPSKVNNFLGTAVYPKVNSSAIKSADDLAIARVLPQINPNSIRFNPTAKNFYNSAVLTGNAQNASEAINPLFNSNTVAKNALSLKMNTPFLNEVIGGIKNKNREVELRAAEDWTNNWVQHPATQEKILNSYKKVLEGKRLNKTEKHNLDEMIKFSSGYNATNRLGEFPLLQQQIGKNNIHNDNYGVSYTNYELPGQILDPIENSYINPKVEIKPLSLTVKNALVQNNPRYGNWISRALNPEERMSTGVHELGHDWLKDYTIRNTDQKEILENAIDHKTIDAILAEYKQTASPEEYKKIEKHIKNDIIDNSEIHARLMEARRYFNLSPDEIITPNRSDEFLSVIRSGQTPIHAFWGNAIKEGQAGADLFNKAWLAVPAVGIGTATLPNKFKQENGLANGGHISTTKTVFRRSELF
jgi:hypothetical protein